MPTHASGHTTPAASAGSFVDVDIRWSDLDAYGHVNNVEYLRYLEEARVRAFADWFGQDRTLLREGVLVARAEIDYLAPLTFTYEPARITMWCSHLGAASFDVAYLVTAPNDDTRVYARAETTLVPYDLKAERPRRLSESERESLRQVSGEPADMRSRRQRTTTSATGEQA